MPDTEHFTVIAQSYGIEDFDDSAEEIDFAGLVKGVLQCVFDRAREAGLTDLSKRQNLQMVAVHVASFFHSAAGVTRNNMNVAQAGWEMFIDENPRP